MLIYYPAISFFFPLSPHLQNLIEVKTSVMPMRRLKQKKNIISVAGLIIMKPDKLFI